ncbi:MAG: hypothetical protein KKA73_31290 [Chloroflexi bacterium]|nr:hypothetical protein [Chloroflexota bacterium]MBU1752187.1 hypothetical protein [Chloroflexota bacterium]
MIQASLHCATCTQQVTVAVVDVTRHKMNDWGAELLAQAREAGWLTGYQPRCHECVAQGHSGQVQFSFRLICNQCQAVATPMSAELLVLAQTGGRFSRRWRAQVWRDGWRFRPIEGQAMDLCPACQPVVLHDQRVELAELVWSDSTVNVAVALGISDKAVEKRCKRRGVPKPPKGFWAKYDAGYIEECRELIPLEIRELLGEEWITAMYAGFDERPAALREVLP